MLFKETLNRLASLIRFGNLGEWGEFPLCYSGQYHTPRHMKKFPQQAPTSNTFTGRKQ